MRPPVRGLSWPFNETRTQAASSLTTVQAILSPQHLLDVNLNVFFQRVQFANINALVPQSASSNDGENGFSIGATDNYQFASGMALSTVFQYMRFNSNAGGQGSADMLLTPNGWGGNFFNSWVRNSSQFQFLPTLLFSPKSWHGHHEIKAGVAITRRSYSAITESHPVQLLRQDGSLAEQIDFLGAGRTSGADAEISEFLQDHWTVKDHVSLDLGARFLTQTAGSPAAFAPRAGVAYSPGSSQKTVIRAGAGVFDDRVPLLATDFPLNLTRVVSYFDAGGQLVGTPVSLQNVFLERTPDGGLAIGVDDLDALARNLTWNIALAQELLRTLHLRINYLQSSTRGLPVVLPLFGAPGEPSFLGLADAGTSRYHAFEVALHYQPTDRNDLTVSYIRSSARSDLNLLPNIFIPFEQPVIRPNVYGISPYDVPDRVVASGTFALPFKLFICPVVDIHTGLPYSTVDVLQNYVATPNGARFPTYFSLDFQVYREFDIGSLPFLGFIKGRRARLGIFSLDVTNRQNPNSVYNSIASPNFGRFAGFDRRVDGFVFELH
jgi:hypothetical protein